MKLSAFFITLILLSSALFAVSNGSIDSGIIIYTKATCPRCSSAIDFLKSNNIHFTEYPVEEEKNNRSMWEAIRQSGKYEEGRITMPVIIMNGEVFFSIINLDAFLENLARE